MQEPGNPGLAAGDMNVRQTNTVHHTMQGYHRNRTVSEGSLGFNGALTDWMGCEWAFKASLPSKAAVLFAQALTCFL